jgi:hypothetical protein
LAKRKPKTKGIEMEKKNENNWIDGMEFLGGWTGAYVYKLYRIPRAAINELDEDGDDAHKLIGLDDGIRRVDITLDMAYGQAIYGEKESVEDAILSAPESAVKILKPYLSGAYTG